MHEHTQEEDDFDSEDLPESDSEEDISTTSATSSTDSKKKLEKPFLLGYLGDRIRYEDDCEIFASKIGGKPNWLVDTGTPGEMLCHNCHSPLLLIVQAYAPLDEVQPNTHRSIYLFACKNPKCSNTSEGWMALRCQTPIIETPKVEQPDQKLEEKKSLFDVDDSWGEEDSTWNQEPKEVDLDALLKMRDLSLKDTRKQKEQTPSKPTILKKDSSSIEEPTILQYLPFVLDVDDEPEDNPKLSKKAEKILKQYEADQAATGEQWGREKYEKGDVDAIFAKFEKRLARSYEQCVRYCFDGTPLWISNSLPKTIPLCESCGASRVFEMQLMPTMISLGLKLNKKGIKERIDFGVVVVYTCSASCYNTSSGFSREYVFVQPGL